MSNDIMPPAGGYAAAPGWLKYSRGVRALPEHAIARVRFEGLIPLDVDFTRIAAWLRDQGRPLTSLCACGVRSPAQFTEEGFDAFNRRYVETLRAWGVIQGDVNQMARTNLGPPISPPKEPSFHPFCYVARASGATLSFVASGAGETTESAGAFPEGVIAYGDTGAAGMRRKASAWSAGSSIAWP